MIFGVWAEIKLLTDQDFTSLLLAETRENMEQNWSNSMFNEYKRKGPGKSITLINSDCKRGHRELQ